jgi:hypothetical protein
VDAGDAQVIRLVDISVGLWRFVYLHVDPSLKVRRVYGN